MLPVAMATSSSDNSDFLGFPLNWLPAVMLCQGQTLLVMLRVWNLSLKSFHSPSLFQAMTK